MEGVPGKESLGRIVQDVSGRVLIGRNEIKKVRTTGKMHRGRKRRKRRRLGGSPKGGKILSTMQQNRWGQSGLKKKKEGLRKI